MCTLYYDLRLFQMTLVVHHWKFMSLVHDLSHQNINCEIGLFYFANMVCD